MSRISIWMLVQFFIFTAHFLPRQARAEYRVFELEIVNDEKGTSKKVITTLDNNQYPILYPVSSKEYVRYVTSWMCWGSTQGKALCRRPDESLTDPTAKNPSAS